MTCWPLTYWIMARCCRVEMMSSVLNIVMSLRSLMLMLPSLAFRIYGVCVCGGGGGAGEGTR